MRKRLVFVLATISMVASLLAIEPAAAHNERHSQFPDGSGSVPVHRASDQASEVLVVCKDTSPDAIANQTDDDAKGLGEAMLDVASVQDAGGPHGCYEHIQQAVDAVSEPGTNIYVLPGEYREQPSWDENAECTASYNGGEVSYDLIVSCGEVINLVTIAGDSPDDPGIACGDDPSEVLCNLQIEGTGDTPADTKVVGGFRDDGDWVKHNGIKADRADGFYLKNVAAEIFRENAIYVHETDGYVLEGVEAHHNDLYGILTFTSDHGLIKDCDTSFNGDSGIYPGSSADVNADGGPQIDPITRWSVEITGCRTHHNALGYSGTAGNSVYFHDNEVDNNGAGYVTDSFVGGHPGMPQDSARLENNDIHHNNSNYYEEFVHSGICAADRPGDRGHGEGTVCPAFPVPVGTGILIAGGNNNLIRDNHIYDNWRNGVMLFWVPGAIRGDMEPLQQLDTSNGNRIVDNHFGFDSDGAPAHNGLDMWWDDQGVNNCWQGNDTSYAIGEVTPYEGWITHNSLSPVLPSCESGGSISPVGNAVKSATLLPCAVYDREDNPDPLGCDWFDSPQDPRDRAVTVPNVPGVGNVGVTVSAASFGTPRPLTEVDLGQRAVPSAASDGLPAMALIIPPLLLVAAAMSAVGVRRRLG
ncbi:MAG TPA: right-handed parallel beta-helix repeat-containing protein [Acidimicrobiales bacterium]